MPATSRSKKSTSPKKPAIEETILEDIPEEEQDGVDPTEDDYLDGDYVADADEADADSDIDDPKVQNQT